MTATRFPKKGTDADLSFASALFPLSLVVGGVFVQLAAAPVVGFLLFIAGMLIFYVQYWAKEPAFKLYPSVKGDSRWVGATTTEIARIEENLKRINRFEGGCFGMLGHLAIFFFVPLLVGALCGNAAEWLRLRDPDSYVFIVWLDLTVFLAMYYWVFAVYFWRPATIEFKLAQFKAFLAILPEEGIGDWTIDYQLQLNVTAKGEVPTDMKVILKPPDAPEEFYGVQVQLSQNRGGPYLYFVVVAATKLPIAIISGKKDVIEHKDMKDVNVLVIRQHATKTGGYQTTDADNRRLLRLAIKAVDLTFKRADIR